MAKLRHSLCYVIRAMEEKDIPQVIEIDREAFPTQWPHPTYSSLKHELRNRLAHYIVICELDETLQNTEDKITGTRTFWEKLLELKYLFNNHNRFYNETTLPPAKEYVTGIAGFWLMVGEAHITTIAVRNAHRRQGIGELLLISTIEKAIQLNAHVVTLEVRTSNEEAQSLYNKYGFYQAGIRKHYYSDNGEDAFIMSTDLTTSLPFKSRFNQLKNAYEQKQNHYITLNK